MNINSFYSKLTASNKKRGYYLNPDKDFTKSLLKGLLINEKRYGYQACPCRLAMGNLKVDLDIICPCDYRDADLLQYGNCYCGLYVTKKISETTGKIESIPERRPNLKERLKMPKEKSISNKNPKLKYPVWRCSVCGYICARDNPPEVCPICGASHERFSKFM